MPQVERPRSAPLDQELLSNRLSVLDSKPGRAMELERQGSLVEASAAFSVLHFAVRDVLFPIAAYPLDSCKA